MNRVGLIPLEQEETVLGIRSALADTRRSGCRIALVPTMGALHEGHLSLMRCARNTADRVVASIFVNPTQFGPGEDLAKYPERLQEDRALLAKEGVDLLFAPASKEMYPGGFETQIDVPHLSEGLCGASRPNHFRGVATVVLKLLNIVQPTVAVFGSKDFQQFMVIEKMVSDLNLDVSLICAPLVREQDGLAMSSRNRYLNPGERSEAAALSRGLFAAAKAFEYGERSRDALLSVARARLKENSVDPEYLEIRRRRDLVPVDLVVTEESLMLVAARVGSTRLIDNVILAF